MAQVLIRGLSGRVLAKLKSRARRHGRSLQAELLNLVEDGARREAGDPARLAARIRRRLAGRSHSDSAALVAKDRAR